MKTKTRYEAVHLFIEFLASHPTDEEILRFTFPKRIDVRIQELADKNNAGNITVEELSELQEYERLDTYGGLLKTKVMHNQNKSSVTA